MEQLDFCGLQKFRKALLERYQLEIGQIDKVIKRIPATNVEMVNIDHTEPYEGSRQFGKNEGCTVARPVHVNDQRCKARVI